MTQYPRRLIEVDLPIKRISAHARREKSIRHGHISTLHIWWARRPLAACRAVICAALWPDPADKLCPDVFRDAASKLILDFARKVTTDTKLATEHCSPENFKKWSMLLQNPVAAKVTRLTSSAGVDGAKNSEPPYVGCYEWLRAALLDFIADFANWDNSTVREYLDTSRALTAVAHASLSDSNFSLAQAALGQDQRLELLGPGFHLRPNGRGLRGPLSLPFIGCLIAHFIFNAV